MEEGTMQYAEKSSAQQRPLNFHLDQVCANFGEFISNCLYSKRGHVNVRKTPKIH